jgi:hypothetical protein
MEMETWKYGDMETWRHGNMETWKHGNMETWKHGDMEIWRHGDLKARRHGHMETWKHKDMETRRQGQRHQTENGKQKHRRFSLIHLLFSHHTNRSLLFLYLQETNGSYPFANGLNGLTHLCQCPHAYFAEVIKDLAHYPHTERVR